MAIFKYELRQLRASIVIWSVGLCASILLLFPVIMTTASVAVVPLDELISASSNTTFFTALGLDAESLSSSLGGYAYLLSVVAIAFATFGGRLGLSVLTKEWSGDTADFLFTKPHSRRAVYAAKTLAALTAIAVVGALFCAASWLALFLFSGGGFSFRVFVLLAGSAPSLCFIYFGFGMLLGAAFPTLNSPTVTALGIAFFTYIIGSFSRVMRYGALMYLSPYCYFEGRLIRETGRYNTKIYLLFVVAAVCIAIGYVLFKHKDIVADR